jgi:hypothetical protein
MKITNTPSGLHPAHRTRSLGGTRAAGLVRGCRPQGAEERCPAGAQASRAKLTGPEMRRGGADRLRQGDNRG